MKQRLVLLKLILEKLKISSDISTTKDRKRIQKTIYLCQAKGIRLNYHFGWYIMGPYSPSLAQDYYEMDEDLATGILDIKDKKLVPEISETLGKLETLLIVPKGTNLEQEDWLELVSSVHYLTKESKYDEDKTSKIIEEEKPNLAPYFNPALNAVRESHFGK